MSIDEYSKFFTSIAAVLAAIAWPAMVLIIILIFKVEFRDGISRLLLIFTRVNKASFYGVTLELDKVAKEEATEEVEKSGKITPRQIDAAARVKVQARNIEPQEITNELDVLAFQYDGYRRTLPSGSERTRAMTSVVVKMRTLAPSASDFLDKYMNSSAPGMRLAAITIMQMVPKCASLSWLLARFSSEQPFVFYHAALALQSLGNVIPNAESGRELRQVAEKAVRTVKAFSGIPDQNTIRILESLIANLSSH